MKNEDFLDNMIDRFTEVIKNHMIKSFDELSDEQKISLLKSVLESNISEIAEGEKIEKFKEVLHEAEGKPDIIKELFEDVLEDVKLLLILCAFALEDSDEE